MPLLECSRASAALLRARSIRALVRAVPISKSTSITASHLALASAASCGLACFTWKSANCEQPVSDLDARTKCQTSWERTAKYMRGFRHEICGVDIGGTTAKLTILVRGEQTFTHVTSERHFGVSGERVLELETKVEALGGTLHFIKWFTENTDPALKSITKASGGCESTSDVFATGGGAHRFGESCRVALGMDFVKVGEFDALVDGLRFIFDYMPEEVYGISKDGAHVPAHFCNTCFKSGRFPVLVCNIGTGVSMIKVAHDGAERVGGTSIGGSTFLGLVYQLTAAETFADAMKLAQEGDAKEVDLLVRDIYGDSCSEVLGIPGEVTASSFGRLTRREVGSQPSDSAMAASVCMLVTQSIALYACQLARRHSCRDVVFTGGFLENNEISKQKLAYFVQLEFKRLEGEGRALFLRHAEYAGSLGCLSAKLQQLHASSELKRGATRSKTKRLNH